MKRFLIVVIVLVVAATAVVLFLRNRGGGSVDLAYDLATVTRQPMWVKVSAAGLVEPVVSVDVKSKASGVVVELPIEEGDRVSAGQVIARLDPTEILNELERERAGLAVAVQAVRVQTEEASRSEALAAEGLISTQDLELARLDLERAKSEEISTRIAVANLEERLEDTVLRSPIDGVVLDRLVEIGQVISSGVSSVTGGTSIATIADLSRVYVKADVDEIDIGKVERGQKVIAVPDAFPESRFSGVVERISPKAKVVQNVTTFEVVTVVANDEGNLRAGMNATVEIVIAGRDDTLTVPRKAVRDMPELIHLAGIMGLPPPDRPGGSFPEANRRPADDSIKGVLVKTAGGFDIRPVSVGLFDWSVYEVESGLSEGEEVVVFQVSRALEASREFLERRRRMALPGMRRSSS
jgi:HlyD family secretion protein